MKAVSQKILDRREMKTYKVTDGFVEGKSVGETLGSRVGLFEGSA